MTLSLQEQESNAVLQLLVPEITEPLLLNLSSLLVSMRERSLVEAYLIIFFGVHNPISLQDSLQLEQADDAAESAARLSEEFIGYHPSLITTGDFLLSCCSFRTRQGARNATQTPAHRAAITLATELHAYVQMIIYSSQITLHEDGHFTGTPAIQTFHSTSEESGTRVFIER